MAEFGKVFLIGAGPGELGLLTLKGLEIIKKADCIIYDRLLNPRMLSYAPINSEKIFVGKANHHHTMPQDEINQLLFEKAKEYQVVVRLKGGDPYVFGRGGEEALFLLERGVDVDVVPGVSSSVAALASAGIPITHRGLSKGFQVITAHSKKDEPTNIDYTKLTDPEVTLVFLMGLAHVGEIARELMKVGRSQDTPVAVISNGTTNHQRKCVSTLANIEAEVETAQLQSPSIIVVGDVVTLSEELAFFENRPLFGKTYFLPVITAFDYSWKNGVVDNTRNHLEDELIEKGAEVIRVDAGRISAVRASLSFWESALQNDYIVFTSANGVKAFFWNLKEVQKKDVRALAGLKFAVIGQKTSDTLAEFGIVADVISEKQNSQDLAQELNKIISPQTKVFWLCSSTPSEDLEKHLSVPVEKIVCYENIENEIELSEPEQERILESDGAIFTSGSNARFGLKILGGSLPKNIYSIGPVCTKAIKEAGFEKIHQAQISSYQGIIDLL